MAQKRIELIYDHNEGSCEGRPETRKLASFEVQDSGMLHISFPTGGTVKIGPSGWDDLVEAVQAAFEGTPAEESQCTHSACGDCGEEFTFNHRIDPCEAQIRLR